MYFKLVMGRVPEYCVFWYPLPKTQPKMGWEQVENEYIFIYFGNFDVFQSSTAPPVEYAGALLWKIINNMAKNEENSYSNY